MCIEQSLCFCKTSFGKQFVLLLSTRRSLEQPQVINLFRLFFRSIPNWNLTIWQKTMMLFTGWLDQPGIFLLLDKSRRPHRQVIIFLLGIKLQSSVFSIFGNCQSCILLIFFVHTLLEFRLPVPPLLWISNCSLPHSCSHLQRLIVKNMLTW